MSRALPAAFAIALALLALPAAAHEATGTAGGFLSGVLHPVLGPDHLVAMVAVGLWGAVLGAPSVWALPVAFPLVMAFGGVLGLAGVPLPMVETWIALSGVTLGLLVALMVRLPVWAAAAIVGAFAIFHGHAHGEELPQAADPLAYVVGFVLATGGLHVCGIALGLLLRAPWGAPAVRAMGAAVAAAGGAFLLGAA